MEHLSLFAAVLAGQSLVWAIVWIVVAAVIFSILQWGLAQIPLPQPFAMVVKVILVLLVCVFLINAILTLVGHPLIGFP